MTLPASYTGQTISEGTLKPEDLIPKFLAVLEEDRDTYEVLEADWDLDDDHDEEEQSELLDAIIDALNAAAPDGTFFGGHDGDPACFGFWLLDGSDV